MKRKIFIGIITATTFGSVNAQDIHFSQYFVNPLLLSPALAGSEAKIDVGLQYRDQWQSLNPGSGFKTFAFSGSMNLKKSKSQKAYFAFGLNVFSDQAGDGKMKTMKAELPLACHVKLNDKNHMGVGFVAGFGQRTFTVGNYTWASQYDGSAYNSSISSGETDMNNNFSYLDMGAGLSWVYNGLTSDATDYAGIMNSFSVSMLHVNQPSYSFFGNSSEKLQPRYVIYEKMQFDLKNSKLALVPTFIGQIQGPSMEIIGGLIAKYYIKPASKVTGINSGTAASFGVLYRNADALIINTMFNYDTFTFGFSYDMNMSGLSGGTQGRGGFEVVLKYVFDGKESEGGMRSF